jgi:NIPSNAP
MIYHCIRYTIDRHKLTDFEAYARTWMEGGILRRCGAAPLGYFLPKRGFGGADNIALALLGFQSLSDYERYRARLTDDPDSRANLEAAEKSRCILIEERSYFYRIE